MQRFSARLVILEKSLDHIVPQRYVPAIDGFNLCGENIAGQNMVMLTEKGGDGKTDIARTGDDDPLRRDLFLRFLLFFDKKSAGVEPTDSAKCFQLR